VKLGVLFKSQIIRWVSSGSGRSWAAPEQSWAGPGLLLGILVRFWEALGLSWAANGLLLGTLGLSWAALGLSRAALGLSWTALGRSRAALGAILDAKLEPRWTPRVTKSTPRPSKIEAKTVQDGLDM